MKWHLAELCQQSRKWILCVLTVSKTSSSLGPVQVPLPFRSAHTRPWIHTPEGQQGQHQESEYTTEHHEVLTGRPVLTSRRSEAGLETLRLKWCQNSISRGANCHIHPYPGFDASPPPSHLPCSRPSPLFSHNMSHMSLLKRLEEKGCRGFARRRGMAIS